MHYADGTQAKVGDLIKGTAYNTKNADGTPRVIVGVMLQITPGCETCNCIIGFADEMPATIDALERNRHNGMPSFNRFAVHQPGEPFGSVMRSVFLFAKTDYSECKAFTLVHRPSE